MQNHIIITKYLYIRTYINAEGFDKMKGKTKILGILALLMLITPATISAAQNTPVVKSAGENLADITIKGSYKISTKIAPTKNIDGYKYEIWFQFNQENSLYVDGFIKGSSPVSYYQDTLMWLRIHPTYEKWGNKFLNSWKGTVTVTVKILEPDPDNPGYYTLKQTVDRTGEFGVFKTKNWGPYN